MRVIHVAGYVALIEPERTVVAQACSRCGVQLADFDLDNPPMSLGGDASIAWWKPSEYVAEALTIEGQLPNPRMLWRLEETALLDEDPGLELCDPESVPANAVRLFERPPSESS